MKNRLIYDLFVFHHLQIVFKINANCHFKTTFFLLHFQKWVALRLSTQKIWHSELVKCRRNLIKINFMPRLNVMQNMIKIWFWYRNKWQMFFIRERNSPFCSLFWKIWWFLKRTNPATTTANAWPTKRCIVVMHSTADLRCFQCHVQAVEKRTG